MSRRTRWLCDKLDWLFFIGRPHCTTHADGTAQELALLSNVQTRVCISISMKKTLNDACFNES